MKKVFKLFLVMIIVMIGASNYWVISAGSDRLVSDTRELIGAEVGLVFGTSQYQKDGGVNPFFQHRINAAYELINSGKVEKLLLSGSKDSIYYNEAKAMKKVLIEKGVAEDKILLDDFGNRTIDSIVRLKEVYKVSQCILVTQKYHAYRALFIAKERGIDATCYIAHSPDFVEHFPAIFREVFARPKAIMDIYF